MCDMYDRPVAYNGDGEASSETHWDHESVEDRVILETEITLRTGPNITMKIHEESRSNSVVSGNIDSEEDSRIKGVVKVLNEDSESDYYDELRKTPKTPRKVRFGGESVKLRTPESDTSHHGSTIDQDANTIRITVTDAVSIKTRRSLIPGTSGIESNNSTLNSAESAMKKGQFKETNLKSVTRHSVKSPTRSNEGFSSIPVHNEIELFHNLTRSPEMSRNNTPRNSSGIVESNLESVPTLSTRVPLEQNRLTVEENRPNTKADYDSFTVFDEKLLPENVQDKELQSDTLSVANGKKSSFQQSLSSFASEDELWTKSEALESLVKMLNQPGTCESLESGPAALLLEALFACHHRDRLHTLADDALLSLVGGLRKEILEECIPRLSLGICKMGASSGVKLALAVMKRLPPKKVQHEVLGKGFGHRTREGALQVLMACARLYPSVDVESDKIAELASFALKDRRRRVRQAALETLAATAQLKSPSEILEIVKTTIQNFPESDDILKIVRTRLSRKQLPSVDLDGTVRYSSPIDQIESDWISGSLTKTKFTLSSPLSSASSSCASGANNYWMSNPRQEEAASKSFYFNIYCGMLLCKLIAIRPISLESVLLDETLSDGDKIWQTDTDVNPKNETVFKGQRTVLRPMYILQSDLAALDQGRSNTNRPHDRGRSFSPPKHHRGQYQSGVVEAVPVLPLVARQVNLGRSDSNSRLPYTDNGNGIFRHHDGSFRKSFSSDQLYFGEKLQKYEPYSYSLSSRSSSTSTGSSTRSGFWNRSGIPIPISSDSKLKIKHIPSSGLPNTGPVIAKSSAKILNPWGLRKDNPLHLILGLCDYSSCLQCHRSRKIMDSSRSRNSTPILTVTLPPTTVEKSVLPTPPTSTPLSGRKARDGPPENDTLQHRALPKSSGSESSGYYTPTPPEHPHRPPAFIKMDTEERLSSDIEEAELQNSPVDSRPQDRTDRFSAGSSPAPVLSPPENRTINSSTVDSVDASGGLGEIINSNFPSVDTVSISNNAEDVLETISSSESVAVLADSALSTVQVRRKSKSVIDLQNVLPEINSTRKNINSAPVRNEDNIINNNAHFYKDVISSATIIKQNSLNSMDSLHSPAEVREVTSVASKSKLERRFSRNSTRRSFKATPRASDPAVHVTRPSTKPKEALHQVLTQLESPDWEVTLHGLQDLSKLMRYNPDVIEHQMHQVCLGVTKHVRNLRSQVARVACMTAGELFSTCRRGLDMELEELAAPLLHRTADTNKFLRADANAALDIMCEQIPAQRVIPVITLRGCSHQNSIVRAASVRLLGDIVKRIGPDRALQLPKDLKDKLLLAGANSLTDGNLEARTYGKVLFKHLIEEPNFQKCLHEAVPQNVLRHIAKVLVLLK
ncbi:hypothetical protein GWI33_010519 [Rhynchophorus ferrugineus]|uniref:TOG domain-containing protein n=1 Tax=Rhynchophorus ferrugineus TaxID=354439 RepID=A0A834IX48_RHYFE|nr:hypothetical protein GWI33_010519 [Rhynchophorus ferrugineus]